MIKTFYSTKENGCMSNDKKYYENTSERDIINDLKERRIKLGKMYGFDGTKMLKESDDKKSNILDVTDTISNILIDNSNFDLWNLGIPSNGIIIRDNLKDVAVSFRTSDYPVIVVYSNNTLGVAYCTPENIDKALPYVLADNISKISKENDSKLQAYIGPSIGYNYILKEYPEWAKEDSWYHFIQETDKGYRIDLKRAVISSLMNRGVKEIRVSPMDTIESSSLYSDYAYNNGEEDKHGKFLVGAYFTEDKKLIKK